MLYQEDDSELYDEWLTSDERLTRFTKSRDQIVGRFKVSHPPYVQGPQSSEEDLFLRESIPSRNERLSVRETGTYRNHVTIGQV